MEDEGMKALMFNERLTELRKQKYKSQSEVAKALSVSRSYI